MKEMGKEKTDRVLEERGKGRFRSLEDFYERADPGKESVRHLIAAGAFDAIRRSRRQLLWDAGIMDASGVSRMGLKSCERIPLDEMTPREELIAGYAIQGFSATGHLLELFRKGLMGLGAVKSSELAGCPSGEAVKIGGYCVCLQVPGTAKGFAFMTLEDEEGLVNVILRPDQYKKYRPLVRLEPLLLVDGILEKRDGTINVMAKGIANLREDIPCL